MSYKLNGGWLTCPTDDFPGGLAIQVSQIVSVRGNEHLDGPVQVNLADGSAHIIQLSYSKMAKLLSFAG